MGKQINSVDHLQTLLMDELKERTVLINIIRQEIRNNSDYYSEMIEQADVSDASLLQAFRSEINCAPKEGVCEAIDAVLAKIT